MAMAGVTAAAAGTAATVDLATNASPTNAIAVARANTAHIHHPLQT